MAHTNISIVGVGSMGGAIALACAKSADFSVTAINRTEARLHDLKKLTNSISVSTDYTSLQSADVVFLAVKPQSFEETSLLIKDAINKQALIISVMAGVSIQTISRSLGVSRVVRAMPNLGALHGESMTVWYGSGLTEHDKDFAHACFRLLGKELQVFDEDYVDKATAISASGAGFFAYIIEAYIREVESMGFTHIDATMLTLQTLHATNSVLHVGDTNPEEFRKKVTSKKGTTEAGLKILMKGTLSRVIRKTLLRAYKRARELSRGK